MLWDKDRDTTMRIVKKAYEHGANLELVMLMGRVAEEEGEYGRAYNLYQMSYGAGSSEGLYRLACLCYDGKFQPGEQDGKKEAAAWLEYADRIRPSKINQNSYIYIASKENFPKTKLAHECVQKMEADEAFRAKYGECTLNEMVEQAKANGDVDA